MLISRRQLQREGTLQLLIWIGKLGKSKEGDIVIIDSSYKLYPFTPDTATKKRISVFW